MAANNLSNKFMKVLNEVPNFVTDETAPIEQPTGNLTYYVAECMEFSNLGEYHDNLSLEEAVRIYQEIAWTCTGCVYRREL